MGSWVSSIQAITLFVPDLQEAKRFYREVFDLPVYFEDAESAVFKMGSTLVNLLVEQAAVELVEPAPVAPQASGVRIQFSVEVPDVDEACARLALKGVMLLNGPMNRPWGIRTASFRDPGGHVWELAGPTLS